MASAARTSSKGKSKKTSPDKIIRNLQREIEKEMRREDRKLKRERWDLIPDDDLYALEAIMETTQQQGKNPPKCHPQDKECTIMGGMRGGTLDLPNLLKLKIILSKQKRDLTLLERALKRYNSSISIAVTTKRRTKIRDDFIKINKIVPELASLKVDEESPKVEQKLAKVNELLKRSSEDLAINPPSSSDLSAPASAPRPTRKRTADLTTTQTRRRPRQHSAQPPSQAQVQSESDSEDYSDVPPRATATIQAAKGKGIFENIKGRATATLQRIGILGGKRTRKTHNKRKAHKKRVTRKRR